MKFDEKSNFHFFSLLSLLLWVEKLTSWEKKTRPNFFRGNFYDFSQNLPPPYTLSPDALSPTIRPPSRVVAYRFASHPRSFAVS